MPSFFCFPSFALHFRSSSDKVSVGEGAGIAPRFYSWCALRRELSPERASMPQKGSAMSEIIVILVLVLLLLERVQR